MPAIQSISCEKNTLTVIDQNGSYSFDASDIPADKDTIQKLEDYLNDIWLPKVAEDYQIKVHIESISPLVLSSTTANIGEKISDGWWIDKLELDIK